MLIRVNKKISSQKPVKYAAVSSGTISHVWYDEASDRGNKRQNRIRVTRDMSAKTPATERYDA